jgi:tetratricopeptide (TPR) repeat protein
MVATAGLVKGLRWSWMAVAAVLALPCPASGFHEAGVAPKHAAPNPLVESEKALMQGRADDAAATLQGVIAANPKNGAAHLLLCRVFYAEEAADAAVSECEAALTTLSMDSNAQDWMGRAYGLKADRSGPLTGYKLAAKVRAAFEAAVELNPKNDAAVDDLSEYYVGAPAILGGGTDKALELAGRVESQLPQSAHRTRALAADKEHDFGTAEREFKAAVAEGGNPGAWFDLGHFYYHREEKSQAVDALRHAIAADPMHGPTLVDVASVLIKMKVEKELAEHTLRDYLASNAKTDAAPAFKAYVDLGKLMESGGDKAGAAAQFQNALGLARDYVPAKRALQHS